MFVVTGIPTEQDNCAQTRVATLYIC